MFLKAPERSGKLLPSYYSAYRSILRTLQSAGDEVIRDLSDDLSRQDFQGFKLGTAMTVSTATAATGTGAANQKSFSGASERRRRRRAKISAQVHIRVSDSQTPAEEVCTSVDVSRDGLLFTTGRVGYAVGQQIDVTFPYSSAASALNKPEPAEVVRVSEQPNNRFGVAIQFIAAKPAHQRSAASSSVASGTVANAQSSQRADQAVVLAVESDPKTAEIMRGVLQQDGYTVIIVPTASEALEVLKTTIPAVFVAEVEGKDMSGHDLCLIVKRNERLQRVPVILLTRSAQPADYSASHQLGAVVCMAKPFKPERLQHVVRLVAPPPTQKSAYGHRVVNSSIERAI
jgi:CheY-like chemotaxis protein